MLKLLLGGGNTFCGEFFLHFCHLFAQNTLNLVYSMTFNPSVEIGFL